MGYQTVKSVEKAFAILELLTGQALDDRVLTLSEIASATGLLPVTARNLLRTLEECGYVNRVAHGRYREGEKCFRLFRTEGVLRRLREVAEPVIRQTSAELGESLLLVTLIRNKRVELLRCQAPDDPLVSPQWSANEDFYRMRTTRVILAWLSPSQLESFLDCHGLPSEAEWPECGGTVEGLQRTLSMIRSAGGCCEVHGANQALAVPVLTAGNEAVASLGCYAPLSRTDRARATGIFQMLHDCAALIQERIGV